MEKLRRPIKKLDHLAILLEKSAQTQTVLSILLLHESLLFIRWRIT